MLPKYLDRIGVGTTLPLTPTPETLRLVHKHHAMAIPFENLTLAHAALKTGDLPPVEVTDIYKKMVLHKRGGWCFEQNGLLHHMLTLLGFEAYEGLARVVVPGSLKPAEPPLQEAQLPTVKNPGATIEVSGPHKVVFVRFPSGDLYLADTGFGGQGLLEPLLVKPFDEGGRESRQAGNRYRVRRGLRSSAEHLPAAAVDNHPDRDSHVGWYLQAFLDERWADIYFFTLEARLPADFDALSMHTALQHPLFTENIVVTQPLEDGRLTLLDLTFKVRREGQPTEVIELESEEERDQMLATRFGIDLTAKV